MCFYGKHTKTCNIIWGKLFLMIWFGRKYHQTITFTKYWYGQFFHSNYELRSFPIYHCRNFREGYSFANLEFLNFLVSRKKFCANLMFSIDFAEDIRIEQILTSRNFFSLFNNNFGAYFWDNELRIQFIWKILWKKFVPLR